MSNQDLATLFDGIVPAQLARNDIAGAVVSVVANGKVLFARGYGYADAASGKPASATDTLFRIGSVSKLMTWTAVMQLVEQGKIDLDADINQYLDFRIPAAYGKPVTMRNLMTHTAGFEDTYQGLWARDADAVAGLGTYLATRVPARIFEPGTVAAYSNYGSVLAGYIVQRVSGEPFDTYVGRHIAAPLGMRHTTFAQPLPAALAPSMSSGYLRASDGARPFELMLGPAGGASTTAADMARFMLAHLHGGGLGAARILAPASVAMMQARQHAFDPRDNAVGLGWVVASKNGHRILGHDGASLFYHANLMLVPDAQVGVFVAYNSKGNGAGGTLGPLFGAFMDRYFPGTPAANAAPSGAGAGSSARSIAGSYMPSRRGESNMAYLAALLQQTRVSMHDDGSISLTGTALRWHETAPGFWQAGGSRRHLIFRQDATGRWQFSDGNPVNIHQRAAWYQHSALMISLLVMSIVGCSVSVAVWAVRAVRGNPGPGAAPAAATANLLVWGAAAVLLALAATRPELVSRAWFDRALSTLQVAGWGVAAGLVAIMWRTRRAWLEPGESGYSLALRGLAFLACLASLLFAWQANLLAFGLRY